MKVEPGLYNLKIVSVATQLPPIGYRVIVYTGDGNYYVGARVEFSKSKTGWALIFNGKAIGVIENVLYWGMRLPEEISNKLESSIEGLRRPENR